MSMLTTCFFEEMLLLPVFCHRVIFQPLFRRDEERKERTDEDDGEKEEKNERPRAEALNR
jgi:hypothetical protein